MEKCAQGKWRWARLVVLLNDNKSTKRLRMETQRKAKTPRRTNKKMNGCPTKNKGNWIQRVQGRDW